MNVPDGMEVKQVKGGTFAKIHYTADPDKRDPEWIEREKAVTTPRFWRVQMEMDDTLHEGEPVWLEWKDQLHCLETLTKGQFTDFPIHEQSLFWGGWDCGNTLWPAFCLAQQTPAGQIFGMCEVTPTAPMSMALFAPIVKRFLETNYSRVGSIRHVGDESGAAQQGAYGDSAFKVAAKSGFRIMAVPNAWTERQEAVSWGLIDMIDEATPRMIISATKCPVLVAGFRGAYQVKTVSVGAEEGPGAVYARPIKDGYSHIQDAWQYLMVVIRRELLRAKRETPVIFDHEEREKERVRRQLGFR